MIIKIMEKSFGFHFKLVNPVNPVDKLLGAEVSIAN